MNFTFGRNLAAVRLEKLVEKDPWAARKISTILSDYTHKLLLITGAKDPNTVHACMELLRDYTLRRIDIKKHLTEEMKSYSKNLVIARYRAYRKGFDAVIRMTQALDDPSKTS